MNFKVIVLLICSYVLFFGQECMSNTLNPSGQLAVCTTQPSNLKIQTLECVANTQSKSSNQEWNQNNYRISLEHIALMAKAEYQKIYPVTKDNMGIHYRLSSSAISLKQLFLTIKKSL